MNTTAEMNRLSEAVAALFGLDLSQVLDAQLDLAREYRTRLVEEDWLASEEDADLLGTLPEFWTWWRQLWANRDRVVLDKVPPLLAESWQSEGIRLLIIYQAYHGQAAWGDVWPNDVVMKEFYDAKQAQNAAYKTLKFLFAHPQTPK